MLTVPVLALAACGSGTASTTPDTPGTTTAVAVDGSCTPLWSSTPDATTTTTAASTGGGAAGGGAAPGAPPGGTTSATVAPAGTLTVTGGTESRTAVSITASAADTSGVLVTGGGTISLGDVSVSTTGSSSSTDESSFYGLAAGVLATGGSTITMDGGSIVTSGSGANGAFASETGSTVVLCRVSVEATGAVGHGIMAAGGGAVSALDLTVATTGTNGAAIATDRGGGTMVVQGGTYTTAGADSPVIYSTGTVSVDGIAGTATGAEGAVIEGSNSITVTNSTLSGAVKSGVMLLQTMSGDSSGSDSHFSMSGGTLANEAGPLLFVTNTTGTVTLTGVAATAGSGVLLRSAADRWGTSGSNGGNATVLAVRQALSGDVVVDALSSGVLDLSDGSSLTGAVDSDHTGRSVTVRLDASSTWTVTADSYVTTLEGAVTDGTDVVNVVGGGHTVHYDSASSPALGGRTYALAGGGTLTPA
jgi:hypothetical protein